MASISRRPSGRYRVRWRERPGGPLRSKTFDRKGAANAFRIDLEADLQRGAYVDPQAGRITFRQHAERWRLMQPHRPSTARRVENNLRNHTYPVLGDRPIADVRPSDRQAWVTGLDLAPSTVKNVYGYVSAIFWAAVEDRIIATSPCTRRIRRPKVEKSPPWIPTTEQVHALSANMPDRYRAMIVLTAGTGMRQGEIFGLTVDRIDFLHRQIHVDRQLTQLASDPPKLGALKTDESRRTIPLPDVVGAVLAAHLERYPQTGDGLVFTLPRGGPVRRSDWYRDVWRDAVAGLGFPPRKAMHSLRHYYASALIHHGASVTVVQHRLGHSSPTETLNTYSHLWPDSDEETVKAITAELGTAEAAVSWLCPAADG